MIFEAAEAFPDSWAAAVRAMEDHLGLPARPGKCDGETKSQRKYRLRQHMLEDIGPAMQAMEQREWADKDKNQSHWAGYDAQNMTVAQLATTGIGIEEVQSWAQLKLQGYFSMCGGGGEGPATTCRLCRADCAMDDMHLFQECPTFRKELRHLWPVTGQVSKAAFGASGSTETVRRWAESLHRLAKMCRRACPDMP